MRIGHGYDVHRFQSGDFITLGGVQIAHNKSFVAHSDMAMSYCMRWLMLY